MPQSEATMRALRRLAKRLDPKATAAPRGITIRLGSVTQVTAGAAADGKAAVMVQVGLDTVAAPYLASYTSPAVGDTVMVLLVVASPIILGRVIGLPSF